MQLGGEWNHLIMPGIVVCPAGVITKREEDGAVITDRMKCIGC